MILRFCCDLPFWISNFLNYFDFLIDIIMYIIVNSINFSCFSSLNYWFGLYELLNFQFFFLYPVIFITKLLKFTITYLLGDDKFSILIYVFVLFTVSYFYLDIEIFFRDFIEFIILGLYYFYFFVKNVFIYYLNSLLSF